MKIFIAVPTYENITPDTFKSIYGLDHCGHWLVFDYVRGYDVATARNRIARQTMDEGADYVLMVDNDVVLPSDALRNLLDEPVDVCLGYYAHRDADNVYRGKTCVCKLYDESGKKHFNYPLESEYTDDEMRELRESGVRRELIHGGGMGCALVRADVFRRIEFPWFSWVTYRDGGMLSEDLSFCEKCRMADIPIYVDPRVGCGHLLRHVQAVM
ncbi:MAG: hypothetical protein IJ087_17930 [Eggerthellaceae bacterium]|nr:hypothetical protein [Eggerthellaceae bacterium]